MFPALGESDDEELPTSGSVQPSRGGEVLVLSSSDSEESSVASPAGKKLRAKQDSTRAAAQMGVVVELSTDSEDEALKGLGAVPMMSKWLLIVVSRGSQEPQPPQRRAPPNSWELSDSDQEAAPPRDPKNQPPVCLSDCPAPNSIAELNLQPFPLRTKAKRSQEELDQARQAALNRKKEQEARKRLQEEEKERKKAAANLWKAQKPGECLKHIQVVLDPGLLQVEGGGQLLTTLQAMECSCAIESHSVPRSIIWRRKTGLAQAEEHTWTEEPNILVLVLLEEFVSMVHSHKQVSKDVPAETLQSFVSHIMKKAPGKTLALVVVGLEKYFSSHKHKSQKKQQVAEQSGSKTLEQGQSRSRREKANPPVHLSRVDVEEALVALQLHTGTQIRVLESWKELGDFASMFTKAVAEAPFKRERDKASFSFCLEGDWISGMKVDHSGKGLLQVWKRQIQQLNRVSLEMANAIVAKYPSPQLLVQAYGTHSSEQERYNLLAEIPVRRGDGVTATTRRIGPELSKRVYLLMTAHNPDLSLDVTG
ncbi:hypothetical protein lerEdw1_013764 [Lerista edwardsae]|nr:hypothetical protein lerEdw1_013764 [Lerista edwardsae]